MTITAYTLSSSCRVEDVDKTASLGTGTNMTNTVKLEGNQDISAPVLLVNSTTKPSFNYVYIDTFGRYYYALTPVWVSNNLWRVPLQVDPLMSFKTGIGNIVGIASRLADEGGHTMIIDDELVTEQEQYSDLSYDTFAVKSGSVGFDTTSASNKRIVFQGYSGGDVRPTPTPTYSTSFDPDSGNVTSSGTNWICDTATSGTFWVNMMSGEEYVNYVEYTTGGNTLRMTYNGGYNTFKTGTILPTMTVLYQSQTRPATSIAYSLVLTDGSRLSGNTIIVFAPQSQNT